jgi:polar amino acid transport system substrate-binding protein
VVLSHLPRARRTGALVLSGAVAAVALAACGSSSAKAPTSAASSAPVSGPAALVPASFKTKGTLTVAADASYAPNEFVDTDGKTVIGMDVDLAKALGTVLGLKVQVSNVTFDSILAGIASSRYDLGMSSFTDTKAREKTVDFVTYFSAGTSFFTKASGAPAITDLSSLCGLTVSVEKGTTEQTDAEGQSKTCTTAGKKAVTVLAFDDQNGANLALSSGRAVVSMADSPVAAYQVKQSAGKFVLAGKDYGTAPYGIAIAKGSTLEPALLAAMKQIISDGTYLKVLSTWGVQAGAITDPVINGATS